ncbi:MAG TPA: phospho-sugar mutase [Chthoniobacterales bacterium]|jgi:phosphoglucomutase|nr:phospho-sugar mutase [Chthoniobacterales bacterium]
MSDLRETLEQAVEEGHLLVTSAGNISLLLAAGHNPLYRLAISQLVEARAWSELNDRFFKTLAFGTGGLRGRSIGKRVTDAERGSRPDSEPPEHPCVGTNAMNFYNVSRATQGLVNYLKGYLNSVRSGHRPSLALAHDTRIFSRQFAELTAKVATELGCDVFLFESARSTPELSFAVRHTNATAGIVITASHNPPQDNGYKVYFEDGAQVVEPHASAIIGQVNATTSEDYEPVAPEQRGKLVILGSDFDDIYKARLRSVILQPVVVAQQKELKVVFSPIHGTGGVISVPLLREIGFNVLTVPEQDRQDGLFPTVKSPNPENAEALSMATELAGKENADLVIGTDPDCDRMGVAVRNRAGQLILLTGNQIGSLLSYYRSRTFKELGILNDQNKQHGVVIKTLVTTDLQKAIAQSEGLHCVETLTGFKYIGAKLLKYEKALPESIRKSYRTLPEEESRKARLEHSYFFVFGGEESYGYSGADFVRDKDANAATLMFAEVAAYAKSQDVTLDELLDQIYLQYGYYLEQSGSLVFEGAEGADKIRRLADSYNRMPPKEVNGVGVSQVQDFTSGDIRDSEGDVLPNENMTIFALTDGCRIAVRPSGTEPKIKFYLFGKREGLSQQNLPAAKNELRESLNHLWEWLQADAKKRVG